MDKIDSNETYDVRSIFTGTGIPEGAYRSFRRTQTVAIEPHVEPASEAPSAPFQVRAERPPRGEGALWSSLRRSLERGEDPLQSQSAADEADRSVTIAITSLAGGVGRTTTVANLGQALRKSGSDVLLADSEAASLLPFYFGSNGVVRGLTSMTQSTGRDDGALWVLSPDREEPVGRDSDGTDWIRSKAGRLMPSQVVVDAGTQLDESNPLLATARICLTLLTPELSSVLRVGQARETLNELFDRGEQLSSWYFVLGRYNSHLERHREMRSWLERELRGQLAPCVIREDDSVNDALMGGGTAVATRSDSAAAQDYRELAEWIGRLKRADALRARRSEDSRG